MVSHVAAGRWDDWVCLVALPYYGPVCVNCSFAAFGSGIICQPCNLELKIADRNLSICRCVCFGRRSSQAVISRLICLEKGLEPWVIDRWYHRTTSAG